MYRLFSSPRPISDLGCWQGNLDPFSLVVGYSFLGHVFLLEPEASSYAVFHPFRAASKCYGSFSSIAEFERQVLNEPSFVSVVLRPKHLAQVEALLGVLPADHVYIPQPYPILGGSGEPHTYATGDFWVFVDLVGQTLGYESSAGA